MGRTVPFSERHPKPALEDAAVVATLTIDDEVIAVVKPRRRKGAPVEPVPDANAYANASSPVASPDESTETTEG